MLARRVTLRDFRNVERAELALGEGLTVLCGANGAGKTNVLEGIYFACTGRSCRTANERELVRFGAPAARATLDVDADDGRHRIEIGFQPGEHKRLVVDGAPVERITAGEARPLVSVFMPDRLELVKGAPAARRAHVDQLVAAVWPARSATRTAYARALAQRNAQLARVRAGVAAASLLDAWDAQLAEHGARLMADRGAALELLDAPFARIAGELGLPEEAAIAYRPRAASGDAAGLLAELVARRPSDVERGFSDHGPHRDDVALLHGGRALRAYGSQGQQRLALLALLFAEREVLAAERGRPPLMLLDDVMSELDAARRQRLVELVRGTGQALVTTTDPEHVPGARDAATRLVEVDAGALRPRDAALAA